MSRLIFLTILLVFLFGIGQGELIPALNLELPVVKEMGWPVEGDTVLYSRIPLKYNVLIYISPSGTVDSFTYSPHEGERFVERMANSLRSIEFWPARWRDSSISFVLPTELIFMPELGRSSAKLNLPLGTNDGPERYLAIVRALELSGFELPGIKNLPSYFCQPSIERQVGDYLWTGFEIAIDASGHLKDIRQLSKTPARSFCKTLSNVLLYTKFRPASYLGHPFPSSLFLIARFFNNIQYPTSPWSPGGDTRSDLPFERFRIETRLYLDSLMNPPLPVNIPSGIFTHSDPTQFYDTLEVLARIDTLGNIAAFNVRESAPEPLIKLAKDISGKLHFTPARDASDRKVFFEGRMLMIFDSSRFIRIIVDWLPVETQIASE
jgi:hypothetical protein